MSRVTHTLNEEKPSPGKRVKEKEKLLYTSTQLFHLNYTSVIIFIILNYTHLKSWRGALLLCEHSMMLHGANCNLFQKCFGFNFPWNFRSS